MSILRGDISITDNYEFAHEMLFSNQDLKILTLDENNQLPLEHPNVIGGNCFLPPIDALIAEAEGNEYIFNRAYEEMFVNNIEIEQFIATIIMRLMMGNNILIYTPEINNNAIPKFMDIIFKRYGISIGIINNRPCMYDDSCTPMWLRYTYFFGMISSRDYLYLLPTNCIIDQDIMDRLIIDISPVKFDYQSKVDYILYLCKRYKECPDLIIPFYQG